MAVYAIYYNDSTFMNHDLTDEQFEKFVLGFNHAHHVVIVPGVGLFRTEDIRSILLVPEVKETENPSFDPDLTPEEHEYIRQMEWIKQMDEEKAKEYTDYEGGTMV